MTNEKVYARSGYLWTKIIEADFRDIADIKVSQSLFQKLFGIGTISFNTSGSNTVEIIFKNVGDSFGKKRNIVTIIDNS